MYGAEWEPVETALSAISAGESAGSQESAVLDFKEDPIHYPGGNPDAQLIDFLADEVICFSNADNGVAFIVLGVNDRRSGLSAFTGTDRECDWLIKKIYDNTVPSIQVEAFALERHGVRLVVLRIPRGMTFYRRRKGQASIRVGTSCRPLSEEERGRISALRANPDFTAKKSQRGPGHLEPLAIEQAKALLTAHRRAIGDPTPVSGTALELCGELGLLCDDGSLTVAAEILFMNPRHNRPVVRHLLRRVPGGNATVTEISAPLISAYSQVKDLITVNTSQEVARVYLENGQEFAIPAYPSAAVDETISNAFAHRDWGATNAIVVDQNPISLTIWSPGNLPAGVPENRILTTQSVPRNPVLISALRQLGLAEESSRGFDRMWASMLSSGRGTPTLNVTDSFVEVVLTSGKVDTEFIKALSRLRTIYGSQIFDGVNGLMVARHLAEKPILLLSNAADLMQVSPQMASQILSWYVSLGFLEQLRDAPEWILSAEAHAAFGHKNSSIIKTITTEDWIIAQLQEGKELNSRDIAEELGIERARVTEVLRHLRQMGKARIKPIGPQRGPGVLWIAT